MPLQRPSAFFRDPAEALSRVSPNRAKMYIRCFMAEVAKLVDNNPDMGLSIEDVDEAVLMLDIVESVEPPTRSQVQILSNQVSNLITSITRQHTHMAITAEILCFMVQAIREHAPAPVADMFQSWTPGSYGPYSSHSHSSSSRKARRSSDSDEFCARIDPVEEPTPMPPRPRSPSPSPGLNEVPAPSAEADTCPPHTESTSPPLPHDESTWNVPSDWDTQRGGSRKLRREGAFKHTPDWEAMKNVSGRLAEDDDGGTTSTTDAVDSTRPARPAQASRTEGGTRSSNSSSQANPSTGPPCNPPRRADSPDRAELERRIAELQAYIDAGFEGRLPTYQNKMKERTSEAGSVDVSSSPISAPMDPPLHVPTTPSASGKKRSRSCSQSPSPARSSPSPSAPTNSSAIPEDDDDDTAAEPRAAKRRRVSPARPKPATSFSKAGQSTYRTPAPTPAPEPSSPPPAPPATSVSSSVPKTRTQARRRPLTRTATMSNID